MRVREIGIIGGGPGGLMTAYALQKHANDPFRVTILEASSRLGGKIRTGRFQSAGANYEIGAAEIYDYSHLGDDPLKELIAELGLPIHRMEGSSVVFGGQRIANRDDIRAVFGLDGEEAFCSFDRAARDAITPAEFYATEPDRTDDPLLRPGFDSFLKRTTSPDVRSYLESLIHSDLATETSATSVSYGLQNYLMNDPAYMSLYGIADGNEALPRALAARLSAEIRLNERVEAVELSSDGRLGVRTILGGIPSASYFDAVVVALPNEAIRRVEFRGVRLQRAMAEHIAEFNHPAHYLRISIAFQEKFWAGKWDDAFCMLDAFGGCCLYDESSRCPGARVPVLGWLLAGTNAQKMSLQCDDELIGAALASLPEFMTAGRGKVIEAQVHRWNDAVNAIPGGLRGRSLDSRHRPEPQGHPNLFLVGDYLYDSTLNGVLDSADYVAMWLVSLLTELTKETHDRPSHYGTPRAVADKFRAAPVLAER